MALLNDCTAANRVIHSGKTVSYSRRVVYGSWSYASGTSIITNSRAWEYHRYCSLSYSYVGLTKDAAFSFAASKITLYMRDTNYSEWDSTSGVFTVKEGGSVLMAEITPRHTQGDMWQLDICVREDDSRMTLGVVSPSSLFAVEDGRDYDGVATSKQT